MPRKTNGRNSLFCINNCFQLLEYKYQVLYKNNPYDCTVQVLAWEFHWDYRTVYMYLYFYVGQEVTCTVPGRQRKYEYCTIIRNRFCTREITGKMRSGINALWRSKVLSTDGVHAPEQILLFSTSSTTTGVALSLPETDFAWGCERTQNVELYRNLFAYAVVCSPAACSESLDRKSNQVKVFIVKSEPIAT